MSWHGEERWSRHTERTWLSSLSSAQLAAYVRALSRRAVDFDGQPVTADFLDACRLDAARALERGETPPEEAPDGQ